MLGDVWWFIFPLLHLSGLRFHLLARCSSFVRKDRRCPDLDAESRTGCWGSLGANSSPVRRHANLPNVQVQRDQKFWGFLSVRGHHVPAPTWEGCRAHCKLSCCACFCLLVAVCRSSGWALVLLAFVFLFSWRWCSSLVWGLRVFFFHACGPPGRLSQRQLPGVDRNGVFTLAARHIYHLSRVWANGVLDLGDGFRVLNPMGFFTEAVRCGNREARCTHGARARTQEPNKPRAADNLHV